MDQKYKVLIIGAGNAGAYYDKPGSDNILTHAHAFKEHKGFELSGFVDIDSKKAKRAASIWGCRAFNDLGSALKMERVDIVSVAVPDDQHYWALKTLAAYPLKLVFAEKPLALKMSEAKSIIRTFRNRNIPLLVNYSRRFVPEFLTIKKNIERGAYGSYITGTGYYGKGLLHNGSHLIDLLRYLVGEVENAIPVAGSFDFFSDDESISAVLAFETGGSFFLQYADCRHYTMFEMDLLFEKKRVRICNLGFTIEEYDVKKSRMFRGYKNIVRSVMISSSLGRALYNAADNIHKYLSGRDLLKCTAEDSYMTLKTCWKIKGRRRS